MPLARPRSVLLVFALAIACRQSSASSSSPPPSTPPADPVPRSSPASEPAAIAPPDWREDSRILSLFEGAYDGYDDDPPRPPTARSDTEGVICELAGGSMQCALVPLSLDYYDGCGGAEAIDFSVGFDPEPMCSSISYTTTWTPEPERLTVTVGDDPDDVACLELPADARALDDQLPPSLSTSYPELLAGPHRLAVITVPHDPEP